MYCFECGKQIQDYSKFCCYCGARIDNAVVKNTDFVVDSIDVDLKKMEQDVRKGTLVYLNDIISLEFSINKLQNELGLAKNPIIIHDYWYYWKCFNLRYPIVNKDLETYTKLVLSYSNKLNRYYYSFGEKYDQIKFYDDNGNYVTHNYGRPSCRYSSDILDKVARDRFCTLPVFKKKLFSDPVLENGRDLAFGAWIYYDNQIECFTQVKECIEEFEDLVTKREANYRTQLPMYQKKIQDIEEEIEKAKKILKNLYGLNIIPKKYRNIGCAYFIYDFFSSSNTSLNNIFLHLDLDTIQSQLSQVINNQRDIILQQAITISQNKEIIAQNEKLLDELSNMNASVNSNLNRMNANLNSINENSIETAQWAKIAALNAETCAWIELANYIK